MSNRRTYPAMVIAVAALVVALCGTTLAGYAAGKASGNHLIKKHSLSGNRLKSDSVTGAQVDEASLGTVPTAGTVAPPQFTPLALNAVWHAKAGYLDRPVGFYKDASGFVHLQGTIECTSTCVPRLAVLPPGARPTSEVHPLIATGTSYDVGVVHIYPSGQVELQEGEFPLVDLEGVTFHADQ